MLTSQSNPWVDLLAFAVTTWNHITYKRVFLPDAPVFQALYVCRLRRIRVSSKGLEIAIEEPPHLGSSRAKRALPWPIVYPEDLSGGNQAHSGSSLQSRPADSATVCAS